MYQIGMQGTHLCAKPLFCNLDVATFKKDFLDLNYVHVLQLAPSKLQK